MEGKRVWAEPMVEIYSKVFTPGVSCTAAAYDLANRRWYQLNVGDSGLRGADWLDNTPLDEVPDDEWLSMTVEEHINSEYRLKPRAPDWNTISTTATGFPTTTKLTEDALVRRPILETFAYGYRPYDKLPTTKFNQLRKKTYLSRGADLCIWKDRRCVFKRIQFDCDVKSHENEIRAREAILRCIEGDLRSTSKDQNNVMESRFNVVPILAVVLHDKSSFWIVNRGHQHDSDTGPRTHDIAGFLMPDAGHSLDLLGTAAADSDRFKSTASTAPATSFPSTKGDLSLTEERLLDLACGVRNLSRCGVTHGNICHRNVVLTQPEPPVWPRLRLIDLGGIAPNYEGDVDALGNFFLWCLGHSARLRRSAAIRQRIVIAAVLLKEEDLDRAIGVLSPNKSRKRTLPSADQEAKRRRLLVSNLIE